MQHKHSLYTRVYGKGKLLLLYSIFAATIFSCSKKDLQESSQAVKDINPAPAASIAVNPNLIYQENFEGVSFFPLTGTLIDKTHDVENCGTDWTLSRVSTPFFQDAQAARFEVRKDQPLVGSGKKIRSEVTIIKGTEDNRFTPDIWYSFAVMFPKVGFEYDATRDCINQWYEDGSSETTIRCEKDKAYLEVTPPAGSSSMKQYDLFSPALGTAGSISSMVAIPKDEWHEFVFHFIHSFGADGLIEVWRDGVKIHTIPGRNMHLQYPKWKMGLYKASFLDKSSARDSRVIYFDNIRVGKTACTFGDLCSNSNPPPPQAPPVVNLPPVANAGQDIEITLPVNSVSLKGIGTDTDGSLSATAWTKASGPDQFTFNALNVLNPTVTNLAAGTYTFKLMVTDDKGSTATDDVIIKVNEALPQPPAPLPVPPAPAPTNILSISNFTFVNAVTETDILTIKAGASYSIKQLGLAKLNIRANSTSNLGSVKFELTGPQKRTFIDNAAPYSLMGDDGLGNYFYGTWAPPPTGTYTLKATPYNLANGKGTAGNTIVIYFKITK